MTDKKPKTANLRPFKKGYDPRRNVRGRISTRSDLVTAIERAANMKLFDDRGKPLVLDGEQVTRLDAVIRTAFTGRTSSDKRFLIWLLEFWHGKPKESIDVGGTLKIEIVKASNANNRK